MIFLIFALLSASNIKNLVSYQTGLGFGCLAAFEAKVFHFMETEVEIWKTIEGFGGMYQISIFGRVRSLRYNKTLIMKTRLNQKGYPQVGIVLEKKYKHKSIHRLVAEAFIPNPENKPCINHINGIKNDNRIENLEWCTYYENNIHAVKTGLFKVKLTVDQVLEIRKSPLSTTVLGSHYGVSNIQISRIKNLKNWKHL